MTTDEVLARYRPRGGREAGDVTRVRGLLAGTDVWSRHAALHLTGSALIVHPPTGRVLLRWHPRQRAWLQVGGHADPGETDPLAIALREGAEESGLPDLYPWPHMATGASDSTVDNPPVHIVVVPVTANESEPAHEHADVRYLLATAQPDRARPERPDAPLRWLTVAQARELTAGDNLRETLDRAARLLEPDRTLRGPHG